MVIPGSRPWSPLVGIKAQPEAVEIVIADRSTDVFGVRWQTRPAQGQHLAGIVAKLDGLDAH
jgi:hypothetical protein